MILAIQLILIIVLLLILLALCVDERQKKVSRKQIGKLLKTWDGSERRKFVRMRTDVPIRYDRSNKKASLRAAKTRDLSIGGICMVITEKLIPRSKLFIEIDTGGPQGPISAKGEVVWIKEKAYTQNSDGIRYFMAGIQFEEVPPKYKERLTRFIRGDNTVDNG